MNLSDVMVEVGTRLKTISGLRVKDHPADQVQPPAAIVSFPDTLTFDATYGRGSDTLTLPVVVLVGKVSDRATRDNLAKYCNGAGSSSVKQALEVPDTYTAFDALRVARVEFDVITIASVDYLGALFTLDITGSGGS